MEIQELVKNHLLGGMEEVSAIRPHTYFPVPKLTNTEKKRGSSLVLRPRVGTASLAFASVLSPFDV
jgi:hypothetical protein